MQVLSEGIMGLIIDIKAVPNSGKRLCVLEKGGIKCFLKSSPERGAANKELIKLVADTLNLVQTDVEIIAGLTSRNKKIKIYTSLTKEEFFTAFGFHFQNNF